MKLIKEWLNIKDFIKEYNSKVEPCYRIIDNNDRRYFRILAGKFGVKKESKNGEELHFVTTAALEKIYTEMKKRINIHIKIEKETRAENNYYSKEEEIDLILIDLIKPKIIYDKNKIKIIIKLHTYIDNESWQEIFEDIIKYKKKLLPSKSQIKVDVLKKFLNSGQNIKETAEIMKMKEETVKKIIQRAS